MKVRRPRGRPPKNAAKKVEEAEAPQQLLLLPDVRRTEAMELSEAPKEAPETEDPTEETVAYGKDPVPKMQGVQPGEDPELPVPAEPAPDEQEEPLAPYARASVHEVTPHPKPKHTYAYLAAQTLTDLSLIHI